jgi:hypothetical protein
MIASTFSIKNGRTINRETPVGKDNEIFLISPCTIEGSAAAEKIKSELNDHSIKAKILKDPDPDILRNTKAPIIIIGNLADSKCVKYLTTNCFALLTDGIPAMAAIP